MSSNSFEKSGVPPPSFAQQRRPTTTMTKVRPADRGEAPATEPGAVPSDGQFESQVSESPGNEGSGNGTRREARRSKRQATREKYHRPSVDSAMNRTSAASAPGESRASVLSSLPYPDDFDDMDDDVDDETPGAFGVMGPAVRRSLQEPSDGKPVAVAALPTRIDDADNLADGAATYVDNNAKVNLPVAFEAEVVFDYPNNYPNNNINNGVVVARKEEEHRTVPLKWFLIGGCFMFVAAVGISVGMGLALGGGNDSSSSSSSQAATVPTFPPVVAPTFTPVVAPTYLPVMPPTFPPVAPGDPTFMPVPAPTFKPVVPPTFMPVPAPTFKPVVAPTFAPVVPPTFAPVVAPTFTPQVAPTISPAASGTLTPVPGVTPEPTTSAAVPTDSGTTGDTYPGDGGLVCECRFYKQNIVVSDADDWVSLDQPALDAVIQGLLDMVNSFRPYRRLETWNVRGRLLQPTELSYALDLTDQSLLGNPSTAPSSPFGNQLLYKWEFCVDAPSFLGEYFSSFVTYASANLATQEASIRNAGVSSLDSMTPPDEQSNQACSGRRSRLLR